METGILYFWGIRPIQHGWPCLTGCARQTVLADSPVFRATPFLFCEKMNCAYLCPFHRGKIEWHHPIEGNWTIGLYLCEAHHSLIQGRKTRYAGEVVIDKTLDEMRAEVKALEADVLNGMIANKH